MNSRIVTNYDYFANVKIDIEKAINEASTIDGIMIMAKTNIDEFAGIHRWSSFSSFQHHIEKNKITGYEKEPIYNALTVAFSKNTWPTYVYTYGLKLEKNPVYARVTGADGKETSTIVYISRKMNGTSNSESKTLEKYTYSLRFSVSSNHPEISTSGERYETLKSASEAIVNNWLKTHIGLTATSGDKSYTFSPKSAIYTTGEEYGKVISSINDADVESLHWKFSGTDNISFPVQFADVYNYFKASGYVRPMFTSSGSQPYNYVYKTGSKHSSVRYGYNGIDNIDINTVRKVIMYTNSDSRIVFVEKFGDQYKTYRAKNSVITSGVLQKCDKNGVLDGVDGEDIDSKGKYVVAVSDTEVEVYAYNFDETFTNATSDKSATLVLKVAEGTVIPFAYAKTSSGNYGIINASTMKSCMKHEEVWKEFPITVEEVDGEKQFKLGVRFPYQDETWEKATEHPRTYYTYKVKGNKVTPVFYSEGVVVDENGDEKLDVSTVTVDLKTDPYANASGINPTVASGVLPADEDVIYTLNVYFSLNSPNNDNFVITKNTECTEYTSGVKAIQQALEESMVNDAWYVICPVDGEIKGETDDDYDYSFTLDELRTISESIESAEKMAIMCDTGSIRYSDSEDVDAHILKEMSSFAEQLDLDKYEDGGQTALPFRSPMFNNGNFVRTAVIYAPYTESAEEYFSTEVDAYGNSLNYAKKAYDNYRNVEWALAWLENESGTETAAFKTLKRATAPSYTEKFTEFMCGDLTDTDPLHQTDGANYNLCTNIGGRCIVLNGKTLSGEWMDIIRFRDWLIIEMRKRVASLFIRTTKIPFTDEGIAMITSVVRGVLVDGQTRGGIIRTYTDEEDNTIRGYTIKYPRARDIPAYVRQRRKLTGISFRARLTGAIHFAEITGTLAYGDTEVEDI